MSDYYASENDPASAKKIAERFGFCLVRGVFSSEEMARLEKDLAQAYADFGGNPAGFPDLSVMPPLQWLLRDERVLALARALTGERPVYYRETNANYEATPGPLTHKPYTEYHCDARGSRADLVDIPPDRPGQIYPAYRFGIYFRNYRDYSGGLKVAPASHLRNYMLDRQLHFWPGVKQFAPATHVIGEQALTFPPSPVELYNVPSMPGDIVIFGLRTYHAGGALRFKDRPTLACLPVLEERLRHMNPALFEPVPPGPRNTIFFDFAAPSEEVDFYIKWRALSAPTVLCDGVDYVRAALPGIAYRNDKIIAALADRLIAAGGKDGRSEPTPQARKDAEDLVALCEAHEEFSDCHPLFDPALIAKRDDGDPMPLALAIAKSIAAHRKKMQAEEAVRKAAANQPR